MLIYLRENGFKILVVLIVLAAFSPSALPHALYLPLGKAQHALNYGQTTLALNYIEDAIHFEPAAMSLSETALSLALKTEDWERVESHHSALLQLGSASEVLPCADLQLTLARGQPLSNEPQALRACAQLETTFEQWASEQFQVGNFTTAIPLMEALLANHADSEQMRRNLAFFFAAKEPQEAIEHLRIIQSTQGPLDSLTLDLLITIQDFQEPETPAYLSAHVGQIFARAQEWYLAREAFQRAVILDPDYAQAWGYLGVARDKTGEDGELDLQRAVQLAPQDTVLLTMQAVHYNQINEPETALRILERAVRLDPENPAIAAALGHAFTQLGDFENAEQAYRRATLVAPEEPSFWQLLAEFSLNHESDIGNLALPAARNALILEPSSSDNWIALGYAHYLLEDLRLAERAFMMALERSPTDSRLQYHLGLLFQSQGESQKAIAAWKIAARLSPLDVYAQLSQRALQNLILNQ